MLNDQTHLRPPITHGIIIDLIIFQLPHLLIKTGFLLNVRLLVNTRDFGGPFDFFLFNAQQHSEKYNLHVILQSILFT